MTKYLDPTNDMAFKKVFCDEARMLKLLNALMRLPEALQIESLEYISNEQVPDLGQLKKSIIDIKCKDKQGNTFIVEMQNGYAEAFLKRTQFYASKALTNQVQRGKTYADIAPVILIAIVHDFKPLQDAHLDVITFHRTVEVNTGKSYLKDLSYVFVELDRFNKKEEELQTFEDHWLYFLSRWYELNKPPANLKDKDVLSAYEAIDQFNWTKEELELYDKIKLAADTEALNLKSKFQEGVDKGREEGEKKKAIEMAKEMLSGKESLDKIIKYTKLTKEELEEL
jgi:predicted transposase/invertase (TIGR01784 family)